MPATITTDRVSELVAKARRHDDGARSVAGHLALAVLELAAAVRTGAAAVAPEPATPPAPPRTWTTTVPTQPGWYFFRSSPESGFIAAANVWLFAAHNPAGELHADIEGDSLPIGDARFNPGVGQWSGPIEVPQ